MLTLKILIVSKWPSGRSAALKSFAMFRRQIGDRLDAIERQSQRLRALRPRRRPPFPRRDARSRASGASPRPSAATWSMEQTDHARGGGRPLAAGLRRKRARVCRHLRWPRPRPPIAESRSRAPQKPVLTIASGRKLRGRIHRGGGRGFAPAPLATSRTSCPPSRRGARPIDAGLAESTLRSVRRMPANSMRIGGHEQQPHAADWRAGRAVPLNHSTARRQRRVRPAPG